MRVGRDDMLGRGMSRFKVEGRKSMRPGGKCLPVLQGRIKDEVRVS